MYKSKGGECSGSNNNGGGSVVHKCIICGMVFSSRNFLNDHMRVAHDDLMNYSGTVRDSKEVVDGKKKNVGISFTWGSKRKRSSLPIRKPNKSITFFVVRARQYWCNPCNKAFSNYQVLGGHKRSCIRTHRLTLDQAKPTSSNVIVIQDDSPLPQSSQADHPPTSTPSYSAVSSVQAQTTSDSLQEAQVRAQLDLNQPAQATSGSPQEAQVLRVQFDLNKPAYSDDSDSDNAPSDAPIA